MLCACKMRGEGNMPLNNVNVGNPYCRFVNCHFFSRLNIFEKKACCSISVCPFNHAKITAIHLKSIVSEFGDEIFSTDGKILFYKMCETKVAAERKFTVQQYVGREKQCNSLVRRNLHNIYCKKQHP